MILLVRHAESVPPDPGSEDEFTRPLSQAGLRQADALVKELQKHGVTSLASSPYLRAIQTLKPFAQAAGLEIAIEADFREHCMTDHAISNWKEVLTRQWNDFDYALPQGESFNSTLSRGQSVINKLLTRPGCTALAGHGTIISLILNSLNPAFGLNSHLAMPNPAVYKLSCLEGRAEFSAIQLQLGV